MNLTKTLGALKEASASADETASITLAGDQALVERARRELGARVDAAVQLGQTSPAYLGKISMSVAGVSTQVQVTSESPVVDTKKVGTSTNVSVEELQNRLIVRHKPPLSESATAAVSIGPCRAQAVALCAFL